MEEREGGRKRKKIGKRKEERERTKEEREGERGCWYKHSTYIHMQFLYITYTCV